MYRYDPMPLHYRTKALLYQLFPDFFSFLSFFSFSFSTLYEHTRDVDSFSNREQMWRQRRDVGRGRAGEAQRAASRRMT